MINISRVCPVRFILGGYRRRVRSFKGLLLQRPCASEPLFVYLCRGFIPSGRDSASAKTLACGSTRLLPSTHVVPSPLGHVCTTPVQKLLCNHARISVTGIVNGNASGTRTQPVTRSVAGRTQKPRLHEISTWLLIRSRYPSREDSQEPQQAATAETHT